MEDHRQRSELTRLVARGLGERLRRGGAAEAPTSPRSPGWRGPARESLESLQTLGLSSASDLSLYISRLNRKQIKRSTAKTERNRAAIKAGMEAAAKRRRRQKLTLAMMPSLRSAAKALMNLARRVCKPLEYEKKKEANDFQT